MPITALQFRSVSAKNALRNAVMTLQAARIETASLDARLLLEHVLRISREELLADANVTLTPDQDALYRDLIEKRSRRQPVAQLTERREFWGMTFRVTQATLDPRPDSETLIEAVVEALKGTSPKRLLDLGTGTGCLLLALLKEFTGADGIGVDMNEDALVVAKENAVKLGLSARAHFLHSAWDQKVDGMFDLIVSNPPYIPTQDIAGLAPEVRDFEPRLALDGGSDGLDCYRAIMPSIRNRLSKNGLAAFEIGIGQQRAVEDIALQSGLRVAGVRQDLGGIPRCILIQQQH